jgi:hypothetical protein
MISLTFCQAHLKIIKTIVFQEALVYYSLVEAFLGGRFVI